MHCCNELCFLFSSYDHNFVLTFVGYFCALFVHDCLCSVADDDFLVQVRAQVMTRDDSSGGWLPTNGGGMSVVGVHAAPPPANMNYMIRGRRVCDQAVSSASSCFSTVSSAVEHN